MQYIRIKNGVAEASAVKPRSLSSQIIQVPDVIVSYLSPFFFLIYSSSNLSELASRLSLFLLISPGQMALWLLFLPFVHFNLALPPVPKLRPVPSPVPVAL